LPGIETRLALIYQQVVEGKLSLEQWVDRCCTAPAKLFGLYPRKGELAPGSDADLVVFDPLQERPLVAERLHMNLDYSPYEDVVVRGWPELVLSRGRVVARNGEPLGEPGWGRYLMRGPSGSLS
jgi:dihydropyrimidinase